MNSFVNESASLTGADATSFGLGGRRRLSPQRLALVNEAATMWGRVFAGDRRAALDVQEALTTSDLFVSATGDVLDRELLARYQDLPAVWSQYASRTTVRDFRPKKMIDLLGGRAALDRVPELTEYPARDISANEREISVGKFGGRFAISWESIINDDIDQLRDLPGNLAIGARDTESRTAASVLAKRGSGNDVLFKSGNNNLLTGNPTLSINSLSAALTTVGTRKDSQGRPIVVTAAVLVVPPALEVVANNVVGALQIKTTDGDQEVTVANWLARRVTVVVDPWLSVVDTSNTANSTWYLLPAPTTARPALAVAFLRGHEQPELRVKADTGQAVGGGQIGAEEGSFDIDDVQYRVRHVLGSAPIDPIATAMSTGAGS